MLATRRRPFWRDVPIYDCTRDSRRRQRLHVCIHAPWMSQWESEMKNDSSTPTLPQAALQQSRVGCPRYKDTITARNSLKLRAKMESRVLVSKESEYCSLRHLETAESRECRRDGCSRTAWYANTKGTQQCCSRECEDVLYQQPPASAGQERCLLLGCSESAMFGATTSFCSEAHRLKHAHRLEAKQNQGRQWREQRCSNGEPYTRSTTCSSHEPYTRSTTHVSLRGSAEPSFALRFLDSAHPECVSLQKQFVSSWQHEKTADRVSVVSVIKIEMPVKVRQRHEEYKRDVPNIRRRFHGTSCSQSCDFYGAAAGRVCLSKDCCLCNICLRGFNIEGCVGRSRTRDSRSTWLQYGRGLYFSSSSGKANDFAASTQKLAGNGTARRCMLVADVAAGKAFRTLEKDLPEQWCPPQGHNSVVAEVGLKVNYDQLVVYDEAAALPTYFVVYEC